MPCNITKRGKFFGQSNLEPFVPLVRRSIKFGGAQSVAGVVAVDAAQERYGDGVTEGQVRHELEREVQQ